MIDSEQFLDLGQAPGNDKKQLSWVWLGIPLGLGIALVVLHLVWEYDVSHPVSGLTLEVGVSLVLFSVLLVFQHHLVERSVASAVRRLTVDELRERQDNSQSDPQMPGDFNDDFGPLSTATAFVEAVTTNRLEQFIWVCDQNWRLCRAQAWIFNLPESLGLSREPDSEWNELAAFLASAQPGEQSSVWRSFIQSEAAELGQALEPYAGDRGGWSQRRRIVGPRHEVLYLMALPKGADTGLLFTGPTLVKKNLMPILLGSFEQPDGTYGYRIAGLGAQVAPSPGWPPTWWMPDDPVALENYVGLAGKRPGPIGSPG